MPTRSFLKTAAPILAAPSDAAAQALSKQRAVDLVNTVLGTGLTSALAAGAYQSIFGLQDTYKDMKDLNPQISQMRAKQRKLDKEKKSLIGKQSSIAETLGDGASAMGIDLGKYYDNSPALQALLGGDFSGVTSSGPSDPTSIMSSPAFIPGMLAATVGGAYGGSKLVENVFSNLHRSRLKNHEEQARKMYEDEVRSLQSKKSAEGQLTDDNVTREVAAMLTQVKKSTWPGAITGAGSGLLITALLASLAGGKMLGQQHRKEQQISSKSKLKRELDAAAPPMPDYVYPLAS